MTGDLRSENQRLHGRFGILTEFCPPFRAVERVQSDRSVADHDRVAVADMGDAIGEGFRRFETKLKNKKDCERQPHQYRSHLGKGG